MLALDRVQTRVCVCVYIYRRSVHRIFFFDFPFLIQNNNFSSA